MKSMQFTITMLPTVPADSNMPLTIHCSNYTIFLYTGHEISPRLNAFQHTGHEITPRLNVFLIPSSQVVSQSKYKRLQTLCSNGNLDRSRCVFLYTGHEISPRLNVFLYTCHEKNRCFECLNDTQSTSERLFKR